MREIKFRGLTAKGDMVFGYLVNDKEGSTAYWNEYSQRICWYPESGGDSNAPVKNGTVGQFTGLQDKNGVDIYEGDVVDLLGDGSVVDYICWNDECGSFCTYNDNDKSEHLYGAGMAAVIGNIHQNPELIIKG